jgi:uncharacterized iron-regulated membrane protein
VQQIQLRKLHRTIGIFLAPFFIITALCGGFLLYRWIWNDTKLESTIKSIHNYEIIVRYAGTIVALSLIAMAITGTMIWFQVRKAQKKRLAAAKAESQVPTKPDTT